MSNFFIELQSYNYSKGRYKIVESDRSSDFQRMMFEHCSQCFDNPECINDSKKNRNLISLILQSHGFSKVIFIDELP